MTLQVRLTDGTSALFTFTDGVNCNIEGSMDGWELNPKAPSEEWTVDRLRLTMLGSLAAIRTNARSIEDALYQARRYNEEEKGPRIYLEVKVEDGDAWHRSELRGGNLTRFNLDQALYSSKLPVSLTVERRNYFEGAEVQAPLTNGNGTNNTAGLTIYNCNDGSGSSPNKRHNYVHIASADVTGNLPAPARVELTNTFNSSSRTYTVWIGHNVFSDPANFSHILEGEAVSFGGSDVVDGGASGGKWRSFTWGGDSQSMIARWTLDTTFLNRSQGQWFKLLAVMSGSLSGIRLQAKITFPAGTPLSMVASSQEVTLGNNTLQDIATLQLPPWLPGETGLAPIDLTLYARKTGGGTFSIDFLQVTSIDSYRILEPRGYGAAYQVRLADDAMVGRIWTDGWTPAGKTGHYRGMGKPVTLIPGKEQRLYFMQMNDTGSAPITRTMSVKVYFRPRRLSL